MNILKTSGWSDYELLDSGNGKRFERFGKYRLVRPDPQCIWLPKLSEKEWKEADATYTEGTNGKGRWITKEYLPEKWEATYKHLTYILKLSPFKHTGIFPEQHLQWDWMEEQLQRAKGTTRALPSQKGRKEQRAINVLNLFGYTGMASLVCAEAGAEVVHVDASKSAISWARENQALSGLSEKPIRWILDDAVKFCEREIRRGNTYEGIIMDPPVYGHGPTGEKWEFHESFPKLLSLCKKLLSPNALFLIVNAYAISSSSLMLENVLRDYLPDGNIETGELVLEEKEHKRPLSTGIFARWSTFSI